jgi:hypothetical protein
MAMLGGTRLQEPMEVRLEAEVVAELQGLVELAARVFAAERAEVRPARVAAADLGRAARPTGAVALQTPTRVLAQVDRPAPPAPPVSRTRP